MLYNFKVVVFLVLLQTEMTNILKFGMVRH